jgi:hypothetical protein
MKSSREFHITLLNGETKVLTDFDKAIVLAFSVAISGGQSCFIDVICYSEEDAEAWGGNEAVERYQSDPDASVFERIEIKANYLGIIH